MKSCARRYQSEIVKNSLLSFCFIYLKPSMSHARLDVKLFTLLPSFFLPFKCYSEDTGVSGSDKGTYQKIGV